jgi:hypothetical protein
LGRSRHPGEERILDEADFALGEYDLGSIRPAPHRVIHLGPDEYGAQMNMKRPRIEIRNESARSAQIVRVLTTKISIRRHSQVSRRIETLRAELDSQVLPPKARRQTSSRS